MDPPETSKKEENVDELIHEINEELGRDFLKTFKIFDKIVDVSAKKMNSPEYCFELAQKLGDFINNSSIYKTRKAAAAISQISLLPKLILLREFAKPLSESSLSIEAALSSQNNTVFYKKPLLTRPLAYGCNTNRKLGAVVDGDVLELTPMRIPEGCQISGVVMFEKVSIFKWKDGDTYGTTAKRRTKDGEILYNIKDVNEKSFQPRGLDIKLYSVFNKQECEYRISPNGAWIPITSEYKLRRGIVFIVCGRRVSPSKFSEKFHICEGGKVFAHCNGTLYTGQLVIGLKEKAKDEVMVVFLKEVMLPFQVEGFYVSEDGKSMIFWPNPRAEKPVSPVIPSLDRVVHRPPKHRDLETLTTKNDITFEGLRTKYADIMRVRPDDREKIIYSCFDPKNKRKFTAGLPKFGINFVRILQTLRHFLRIRDGTNTPEAVIDFLSFDGVGFHDKLYEAFETSLDEGRKIRVITSADPTDSDARHEEIHMKAKIFLQDLTTSISKSFDCLVEREVKSREKDKFNTYSKFIHFLISSLEDVESKMYPWNPPDYNCHVPQHPRADALRNFVAERVVTGQIDQADPRFRVIRVEAVPAVYIGNPFDVGMIVNQRSVYVYNTCTEFFIKCIDSSLLEHVENGILNLNNACMDDDDEDRFRSLYPAFFEFPESVEDLRIHEKHPNLDIEKICQNLPDSEKYVVLTEDDDEIEVPADLFHFYMFDYDEARREMAEKTGTPIDFMSINGSAKVVKHLLEMLLDMATVFNLDMETKVDLLYLSDELFITHVKPDLFKMIVLTATESDLEIIQKLFDLFPEQMIEAIGKYRPDIALYWKQLPFDTTNLSILSRLADLITEHSFSKSLKPEEAPLTLAKDEKVDEEPIDRDWLMSQLRNQDMDKDISPCLHNTLLNWKGSENRCLKRCHDCITSFPENP